jgi:adenosylcobinamide-GDP ribazoletransferase
MSSRGSSGSRRDSAGAAVQVTARRRRRAARLLGVPVAPLRAGASSLRAAITFLTPAPMPRHAAPAGGEPAAPGPDAARPDAAACCWFPVVGATIGAATGVGWRAARARFEPLTAAGLGVVADLGATGALHLDGLADSADGLLAHAASKQRLAIMAEPDVGAFGTIAVAAALLLRAAALAELDASPLLFAAIGCASRSVMALACRTLPYARPQGLASGLARRPGETRSWTDPPSLCAFAGLGAAAVLAGATQRRRGAAAILGGCTAGCAVLALACRRIGGYTGDVLGAAGVVTETVALLLCSRPVSR